MSKIAVGIDLGTVYSCAGVWRNNSVEIIPNDQGNRKTPSWVAFTPSERLIGDIAKTQGNSNPENSIFGSTRVIGRRYNETEVQNDIKHWPFKVVEKDGKPMYSVRYKGEQKEFTPEMISSMVLSKMKKISEAYLGQEVVDAVVTCPTCFNDSQRQATRNAGVIAGLKVLQVMNESVAAAIGYGFNKMEEGELNVLIFDYGGGTLDVSVVCLDSGVFEVKSTAGNTHLGGEDLDNILTEYMAEEFRKTHKKDLRGNSRSMGRLRAACERAKRTLSSSAEAMIEVDSLFEGLDLNVKITRRMFEVLCESQFCACLKQLDRALLDSKMVKSKIDEIVLVGGSSRIPRIQQLVRDRFNEKKLWMLTDEAVAYGAAVQAAKLVGTIGSKGDDMLLIDVTPTSLGLEGLGGVMIVLINRNCPIPCATTKQFTTFSDNQSVIVIKVFEGEQQLAKQNNLLGNFRLTGIAAAPRGVPKIEVKFSLDINGILLLTAEDKSSGRCEKVRVIEDNIQLSREDVQRMMADAAKYEINGARKGLECECRTKDPDTMSKHIINEPGSRGGMGAEEKANVVIGVGVVGEGVERGMRSSQGADTSAGSLTAGSSTTQTEVLLQKMIAQKEAAIRMEEYDEAKRWKIVIQKTQEITQKLSELERKKNAFVALEDFDSAKKAKDSIAQLRLELAALERGEIPKDGGKQSSDAGGNFGSSTTPMPMGSKVVGNYSLTKRLGKGTFGEVYKCTKDGREYAIKRVENASEVEQDFAQAISARLNCRFLVRYFESFRGSQGEMYIVMELCDKGDLSTLLTHFKELEKQDVIPKPTRIIKILIQVLLALEILHRNHILHRDLKPLNIFVDKDDNIKIGDFGCSKVLDSTSQKANTTVGTLLYESPEVVSGKEYSYSSDMWALGVLLYEMCTLELPFFHVNKYMVMELIKAGNYKPIPKDRVPEELVRIVNSLLRMNPQDRPTATNLLANPFIRGYAENLDLLKYYIESGRK